MTIRRPPDAHPAATVVLLRSGPRGIEVLLTRRPSTMAFAADVDVFPGGRVDAGDADPVLETHSVRSAPDAAAVLGDNVPPDVALALHVAAIRELYEEAGVLLVDDGSAPSDMAVLTAGLHADAFAVAGARAVADAGAKAMVVAGADAGGGFAGALAGLDIRLATDRLAPIAHWTTPPFMPRRFSTWFFVADLPPGATPVFAAGEVVSHHWATPADALEQVAAGKIQMWVPTTSVLERLIETGASTAGDVARRIRFSAVAPPRIVTEGPTEVRFAFGAVGGLPGRSGETVLVGRRDLVVVDPGDPSDEALAAIGEAVARRDGSIRAIVLTQADPDHAAAAEAIAIPLAIPILVAPGAGRHLPYATRELADGDRLPTDADVRVRLDPPGSGRLRVVPDLARQ